MPKFTQQSVFQETLSFLAVKAGRVESAFLTVSYLSGRGSLMPHLRSLVSNKLFVMDDPSHTAFAEIDYYEDDGTATVTTDFLKVCVPGDHIVLLPKQPRDRTKSGRSGSCLDCALSTYLHNRLQEEGSREVTHVIGVKAHRNIPGNSVGITAGLNRESLTTVTALAVRPSGFVHMCFQISTYQEEPVDHPDVNRIVMMFGDKEGDTYMRCEWPDDVKVVAPSGDLLNTIGTLSASSNLIATVLGYVSPTDETALMTLTSMHGTVMAIPQ